CLGLFLLEMSSLFFFQAEDGIRDRTVTGVQTCALPICGPTYLAIQSQPPGSVDGRLRVTEQGEMIQAQFGLPDIATRTLELYTTATLSATLQLPGQPDPRWRTAMDSLAETARSVYRQVVYDDPRFIEYFRAATPEVELGSVPIGSRPVRRTADGGVDSLRAIPWVF